MTSAVDRQGSQHSYTASVGFNAGFFVVARRKLLGSLSLFGGITMYVRGGGGLSWSSFRRLRRLIVLTSGKSQTSHNFVVLPYGSSKASLHGLARACSDGIGTCGTGTQGHSRAYRYFAESMTLRCEWSIATSSLIRTVCDLMCYHVMSAFLLTIEAEAC
jgi:hypothetical protein